MLNPFLYLVSSHYRNEIRCKDQVKRIEKRIHRRCEEVGDPQWWDKHDMTSLEGLEVILGIRTFADDSGASGYYRR